MSGCLLATYVCRFAALPVPLSVCSSTRPAPGSSSCLLQRSQRGDCVGCATRGGWWRQGRGNRGTFPVEMGLSLHQLLLQLQQWAYRSLGTKPIGIQMGTDVNAYTKPFLAHVGGSIGLLTALLFSVWQDHDVRQLSLKISVSRSLGASNSFVEMS